MKDKKRISPVHLYLFANLVMIGILLVSLWRKQPVWNVNISFPNFLLVLVILNTILLFRSTCRRPKHTHSARHAAHAHSAASANVPEVSRPSAGLAGLRDLLKEAAKPDDNLVKTVVSKLKDFSSSEAVSLHILENSRFTVAASAGDLPAALSGSRFVLEKTALSIRFPGSLGEEVIGETTEPVFHFSSALAKLVITAIPLHANGTDALCIFSSKEAQKPLKLPVSSLGLYLETLLTLVKTSKDAEDTRYKDKDAGLMSYSAFNDSFEIEVERAERYKQEMSLFSIRIGGLEALGANAANQAEHAAAVALKQSLRKLDLMFAGKKQGDMFAILTETGSKTAETAAKRIQKAFKKAFSKLENIDNGKLFVYIGSASYPVHATLGSGLLEKSQDALDMAVKEKSEFKLYENQTE